MKHLIIILVKKTYKKGRSPAVIVKEDIELEKQGA
jgi:hypothetical protein